MTKPSIVFALGTWADGSCFQLVHRGHRRSHRPPDLERSAAKRMGAKTVEMKSSHVPMLSHPRDVLDAIRQAAATVAGK
jgi:hypothetical protein